MEILQKTFYRQLKMSYNKKGDNLNYSRVGQKEKSFPMEKKFFLKRFLSYVAGKFYKLMMLIQYGFLAWIFY